MAGADDASLVHAVHDVSGGGLAVALAEMAAAAGIGCTVDASTTPPSSSRSCRRASWWPRAAPDDLCARAAALGVPTAVLGRAGGERVTLGALLDLPVDGAVRGARGESRPGPGGTRDGAGLCENGWRVKEACGVFGVYAPGMRVANLTFDGLFALQHRGQESAGMAVADGDTVTVVKDMGLVATVFDERTLSGLQGHLAIGHTRYSTHGSSDWAGAQPVYRPVGRAGFALGHNGNLTNTEALAEKAGMLPGSIATDSDVVAELLMQAFPETEDLSTALQAVLPILEGAYSFVLMSSERLFGVRDPYGFRPLCLGRLGPADAPEGWVLASETPALSVIGATFVREVAPGEMVVIDANGPTSLQIPWLRDVESRLCIFEFAYIARPGQPALRPRGPRGALPHGRAVGPAGTGRGRHGDGRARIRACRRPRASPGPAASPTDRGS